MSRKLSVIDKALLKDAHRRERDEAKSAMRDKRERDRQEARKRRIPMQKSR